MFDASRIFRTEGTFDLRRISKIISAGSGIIESLTPLIAHEDNHQLVVFKPAGWLSQPDDSGDLCVSDIFGAYIRQRYAKPGNVFCAAVHRLDRPASGLLVLARTSKGAARISLEIREGRFEKQYRVITDKPLPGQGGPARKAILTADMAKIDRIVRPVKPGYQQSASRTSAMQYALTATLVSDAGGHFQYSVEMETGKYHQIRALFAAHGCPLLGDLKYGGSRLPKHRDRLALMATKLKYRHPTTGQMQVFYIAPPSLALLDTYFI
jgi:23S rRNA pseudouridine1911/1915/1917 synthase